ncbi:MAG: DUF6152 family protein [Steroidobacteraceae bacterium]
MNDACRHAKYRVRLLLSRGTVLAALLAGALGVSGVADAHHSYAMFDTSKTISLDGTVKDFQWTNPHAWIEVVVATSEGLKQYSIEGNNPRVLGRAGWKFNTLKPGDKVTIVMNPLRDGARGGSLVSATLPDGRMLGGR